MHELDAVVDSRGPQAAIARGVGKRLRGRRGGVGAPVGEGSSVPSAGAGALSSVSASGEEEAMVRNVLAKEVALSKMAVIR